MTTTTPTDRDLLAEDLLHSVAKHLCDPTDPRARGEDLTEDVHVVSATVTRPTDGQPTGVTVHLSNGAEYWLLLGGGRVQRPTAHAEPPADPTTGETPY